MRVVAFKGSLILPKKNLDDEMLDSEEEASLMNEVYEWTLAILQNLPTIGGINF